jgi:hypothetical protein
MQQPEKRVRMIKAVHLASIYQCQGRSTRKPIRIFFNLGAKSTPFIGFFEEPTKRQLYQYQEQQSNSSCLYTSFYKMHSIFFIPIAN